MKKLLVVFLASTMLLMFSSVAMAAKIKGVLISKPRNNSRIIQTTPNIGGATAIKISFTTPGHKYIDTVVRIPRRARVYLRRNRSVFRALMKARHDSMMASIRNIR